MHMLQTPPDAFATQGKTILAQDLRRGQCQRSVVKLVLAPEPEPQIQHIVPHSPVSQGMVLPSLQGKVFSLNQHDCV
jgi:hypothetical protein